MAVTKLTNLVNPQVLAAFFDAKLTNNIVFAPLCEIDTTLVGRPGDTLSFPVFSYIGAASVTAEGSDIASVSLQTSTTSAKVEKLAKAVDITDEAMLSGAGDPVAEAGKQLVKSVADALDTKILAIMAAADSTMTYTTADASTEVGVTDINDALTLFGEDIDGVKAVCVSPALYGKIRKSGDWCPASEISADITLKGAVGEVYGCQIIVSNRLTAASGTGNAYIVKPGALKLILKRDTLLEADRTNGVKNTYTVTKHCVSYLYDSSKLIKITKGA